LAPRTLAGAAEFTWRPRYPRIEAPQTSSGESETRASTRASTRAGQPL